VREVGEGPGRGFSCGRFVRSRHGNHQKPLSPIRPPVARVAKRRGAGNFGRWTVNDDSCMRFRGQGERFVLGYGDWHILFCLNAQYLRLNMRKRHKASLFPFCVGKLFLRLHGYGSRVTLSGCARHISRVIGFGLPRERVGLTRQGTICGHKRRAEEKLRKAETCVF